MKSYTIYFYYNTDLRDSVTVKAWDELQALVLARLQLRPALHSSLGNWCTNEGFRIVITTK